jgi:hypothetical protein
VDPRTPIDLPIDLDGRRVRSETLQSTLSPYVLTIGTTLPAQGVSLYSTYHGHQGAPTVAVHLTRAPARTPATDVVEHDEQRLPVVFARARCLRDHALHLHDVLLGVGYHAAIHLSDEIEAIVEAARGTTTPAP